jgi:hypothetical protein
MIVIYLQSLKLELFTKVLNIRTKLKAYLIFNLVFIMKCIIHTKECIKYRELLAGMAVHICNYSTFWEADAGGL